MSSSVAHLDIDNTGIDPKAREPLVVGGHDFHAITELVCAPPEQ